jgi:protein-S-isoprenylcysteine O-methyltransferase Ste14
MNLIYEWLFPGMWLIWGIVWLAASRRVKTAKRLESTGSRLLHIIPLFVAAALLYFNDAPIPFFNARFLPSTRTGYWIGAALTLGGLLFTGWARVVLGRNWSGIVTLKENHELITQGPYNLVRHPIYTGLLVAFLGSALARGQWRGLIAVAIVFWALWRKLRLEERWMREQFGEQYVAYSRRVSALIPYVL